MKKTSGYSRTILAVFVALHSLHTGVCLHRFIIPESVPAEKEYQ